MLGGIASGKSTASRLLRTHKIPVVDLDEIAVEVVKPGTPTLRRLVETFGTDILNEDKSLNRGELGRRAFGDKEKTKLLNKITHGAIRRVMLFRLIKLWLTGARCAVVDTPLLIEAGLYKWCALTVLVWCTEEQQLERMLKRDGPTKGLTEADARARLASQLPLSEKLRYADKVIDNSTHYGDGSTPLREEVEALVANLRYDQHSVPSTLAWLLNWLLPPVGLLWGLLAALLHARRIQLHHNQQLLAEGKKKDE
ncbi:hypothetical protein CBS9595_001159 [Malassezia furfur]|nr:hypothetical protein CBS9595_001159 [Malassezia furfur]